MCLRVNLEMHRKKIFSVCILFVLPYRSKQHVQSRFSLIYSDTEMVYPKTMYFIGLVHSFLHIWAFCTYLVTSTEKKPR